MDKEKETCENCRFSRVYDGIAVGLCRKKSPVAFEKLRYTYQINSSWPSIYRDDWCGDWEGCEDER